PRLPGARQGVEGPEQLARLRVPAANVAVEAETRLLLAVVAAGDDQVAVDHRRRGQADVARDVAADPGRQIDRSVLAELRDRLAGLRVERDQAIAGAGEDPRGRGAVTGPVGDAAAADRIRRGELPGERAGFRLEREPRAPAGQVHDSAGDDRN